MYFAPLIHILAILTWIGDELWCRQAQKGVNLEFQVKFDLGGHCQSLHKTIRTLTKVFCIFGQNLVILALTGIELSRGQASDWHTARHTPTDAGNDNTRRPKRASINKMTNYHCSKYGLALSIICIVITQFIDWRTYHMRHQLQYTRGPFTNMD